MKSRLQGATKGHGLLKKKADALQMRFRMILGKIIEVSLSFSEVKKTWDLYQMLNLCENISQKFFSRFFLYCRVG